MDWFFDNFGTIITFLIILLYFIGSARLRRSQEDEMPVPDDDDEEHRAREVREEIRRKIMERQRGDMSPHEAAKPPEAVHHRPEVISSPVFRDASPSQFERYGKQVPATSTAGLPRDSSEISNPILDYQRRIDEQVAKAREAEGRAHQAAARIRSSRSPEQSRRRSPYDLLGSGPSVVDLDGSVIHARENLRDELLHDLRGSGSLRRAFLLKEVLDKPLALRKSIGPSLHTSP